MRCFALVYKQNLFHDFQFLTDLILPGLFELVSSLFRHHHITHLSQNALIFLLNLVLKIYGLVDPAPRSASSRNWGTFTKSINTAFPWSIELVLKSWLFLCSRPFLLSFYVCFLSQIVDKDTLSTLNTHFFLTIVNSFIKPWFFILMVGFPNWATWRRNTSLNMSFQIPSSAGQAGSRETAKLQMGPAITAFLFWIHFNQKWIFLSDITAIIWQ